MQNLNEGQIVYINTNNTEEGIKKVKIISTNKVDKTLKVLDEKSEVLTITTECLTQSLMG